MGYTVYWEVNDGRNGYPNIVAEPNWSDHQCKSYEDAIRLHAAKGFTEEMGIYLKGEFVKKNNPSVREITNKQAGQSRRTKGEKMKINGQEITAKEFAFDGCHKIYLIEDSEDKKYALKGGYIIYPIADLQTVWNTSCDLRFINTWKLETIVPQFEDAKFEF